MKIELSLTVFLNLVEVLKGADELLLTVVVPHMAIHTVGHISWKVDDAVVKEAHNVPSKLAELLDDKVLFV